MRTIQQLITPSLALLVSFLPLFSDVAYGQQSPGQQLATLNLTGTGSDGSSAVSPSTAGAFTLYQTTTGNSLHGDVTSAADPASFDFDGQSMKTGDGYVLKTEVESPNKTKITITTADHRHATGVISTDPNTQQTTVTGMAQVQLLMQESHDVMLLQNALPSLMSSANALQPVSTGWIHCLIAWLVWVGEAVALAAACGATLGGCVLGLGLLTYAGYDIGVACSGH